MSYCVNCGVELDRTAAFCPLCHTPVYNPSQPVDTNSSKPFPTQRSEVPMASKREAALLMSSMLLSVAVCCSLLNIFLHPQVRWSLFVVGGTAVLWVWLALPLWARRLPLPLRLGMDGVAVGAFLFLIAATLDGWDWFLGLALPIVLLVTAVLLFLGTTLRHRSILSSITLIISSTGICLIGVELFIDRWIRDHWIPGWSLVVMAICVSLSIPLLVVRYNPTLREEVRKRFHL